MSDNSEFFNEDIESEMSKASGSQVNSNKLDRPGVFRMKAVAKKFTTKSGDTYEFPVVKKSSKQKSLIVEINLETVEEVDGIPAGTYYYATLTLSPAKGASSKKVKDTLNYLKPRLSALVGKEEVDKMKYGLEWVNEFLTADFKADGDDFIVTRNHKMVNEVMCTFKPSAYNNKITLNLETIKAAKDGDKSKATGGSINGSGVVDESESDMDAIDRLSDADTSSNAPEGTADINVF